MISISKRLRVTLIYLATAGAGNLAWEVLQLPLYTIWYTAPVASIAFAVLHCTLGDVLIAAASLALAVLALGRPEWPENAGTYLRVAYLALGLGVAYTVFSEWVQVELLGNWAYSAKMPRLPWLGTGLAPFAQWFVVPTAAFWLAAPHRCKPARRQISGGRV